MIKSVYRKERQSDGSWIIKGRSIETNFKDCNTCEHNWKKTINDHLTINYCDSLNTVTSCYDTNELKTNKSVTYKNLFDLPIKNGVCIEYEQYGSHIMEEEIKEYENKKRFHI